jgi:hypothetical protein
LSGSFLPFKVLILLAAACLAWIGLLSLAVVFLMGNGASAGWICAGALFLALVVWTVVMAGEYRSAIELPEGYESEDFVACEFPPHGKTTSMLPRIAARDDKAFAGKGNPRAGRRHARLAGKPRNRRTNQPAIR